MRKHIFLPSKLFMLLLCIVLVSQVINCADPVCEPQRTELVLANLKTERQLYNLSDLFRGYSLTYEIIPASSKTFSLYLPFRLVNTSNIT
jgi:hypothetical protein